MYRFLRRQVRWSGIPISLRIFYSLLWSTQSKASEVNEAEVDVFLEFPCFLYNTISVDSLISGSSAVPNIWTSSVHILLMLSLKDFEHNLLACEMNAVVWLFHHSLASPFFETGMKIDLFQSCGHYWVFQICWHIESSTLTASSFRILNSSVRFPSPPLALSQGPPDFTL